MQRGRHLGSVRSLLTQFPIVAILGARQVGKTTLAREVAKTVTTPVTVFDLEDPTDRDRLLDPKRALERLTGLVVIDEVQFASDLFPVLRVLADRSPLPARFLLLGSASPDLLRRSSESLAGRIAFHRLAPFDLLEVGGKDWERLWERGGFPLSLLAKGDEASVRWRQEFTRTFLERDLRELGIDVTTAAIRRFWTMLAHSHGSVWNASELARAFGSTTKTVGRYLDILCGTFMARRLQPWFNNAGKREVKAPKVYLADSGLLHFLLGVRDHHALQGHPRVGASFEGFAIQQIGQILGAEPEECFFWGVHTGAELDLLVVRGEQRLGFEIKHSSSPRPTKSMHSAVMELGLERLDVVYAGDAVFPLGEKIRAVGVAGLPEAIPALRP
jgi:predicted AAA+ superfamily ATPase